MQLSHYCHSKEGKYFLCLLVVAMLTLLPFIGLAEYHTKGEPREAIVSYSMIHSGNWILPRNNGGETAYKPPFFHWCVAAVSLVRGDVTEGSSRLPSALALIAMTMATFSFFARRKGVQMGLLTALVAFTTFELHRNGVNCRVDMVLTALTVGALYALYHWYERGMRGIPLWAILWMSLATLTKGPVGIIIPCLVTGVFLLLRKENFFKAFFLLFAFAVISLIIPALWYYAAYRQGGQAFLDLVYEENIGRMTNTMAYDSCVNPWYYNIFTLVSGFLPYTLLGLFALFVLSYHKVQTPVREWAGKGWKWLTDMNPVDLFAFVAVVIIFVFYCIPQSKRSVYLMPLYPFLSYFVARFLLFMADQHKKTLRAYGGVLATLGIVAFILLIIVMTGAIPTTIFHGRHAADNIATLQALEHLSGFFTWLCLLLPLMGGIGWWIFLRKDTRADRMVFAPIILTLFLYIGIDGGYSPAVLNVKSVKSISAEIDRVAPEREGKMYEFIAASVRAKGDPVHFFEVNFYLHNRIGNFYIQCPQKGFLLITRDDAKQFFPVFEQEGYSFQPVYRAPKRDMVVYRFQCRQNPAGLQKLSAQRRKMVRQ
ncbi:MAG: glycosyltransferase family 39 protein [Prevotella sp.]|uniref:ArnT family glycosyltransferase n=1 Tax=Prevotella sp. AGR2160 TaxID=1280674 RepID=UPI00041E392B|nr:glycosyltransferase family 39 protein [Prevotella sp. AGR2160]MDD5861460.1 glycosyltransferase family 39 protein [Prevotella sp.]